MSLTSARIIMLEKSYDYHLKEMCRHDSILEWIDAQLDVLEERYARGQLNEL